MSRVGREPIPVPEGVKISIDSSLLKINGKLGELEHSLPNGITAVLEDNVLRLNRKNDTHDQKALHGLSRALLANMVHGVSHGYKKDLEIIGVGYRCDKKGKAIQFAVGFSHRVVFIPPDEIEIKVTDTTKFNVSGIDKQLVGDVSAKIRAIRPPEPYKGKGIRYVGEKVRRKAGKTTVK
ncbi:50S ribosomal protein L6 [bacterium]|nr:50S ribosomal protein L6 [bacterium]